MYASFICYVCNIHAQRMIQGELGRRENQLLYFWAFVTRKVIIIREMESALYETGKWGVIGFLLQLG